MNRIAFLCLLLIMGSVARAALAGPCLDSARRAEQAFGVPDLMLQSIVMQESGDQQWALNADGQAIYPVDEIDAKQKLRLNLRRADNVDIGCGQISMKYHSKYFSIRPDMALDPWINMVYASKILLDNYQQYKSWTKAVAHYHSGDEQRQQEYLCLIMQRMARLKGQSYRCSGR